jgi:hypothetical protein
MPTFNAGRHWLSRRFRPRPRVLQWVRPASCFSAASWREALIGGCLYQKQLDLSLQKLNILRKKEKFNFKIVGIGWASTFIFHNPNVRYSMNEKGSYYDYVAEPRR